jgi:hypothetical protein
MLLSDINYLKRLRYVKSIDLSEINREHAAIFQKIYEDFPVA